jgi:hypothetical protein
MIKMAEVFKKQLPEVYENVRRIQSFLNSEMPELWLTKEEDALMMMLKRTWKIIPTNQVPILNSIQEKISAYYELM